jgi:hypothetical protein
MNDEAMTDLACAAGGWPAVRQSLDVSREKRPA